MANNINELYDQHSDDPLFVQNFKSPAELETFLQDANNAKEFKQVYGPSLDETQLMGLKKKEDTSSSSSASVGVEPMVETPPMGVQDNSEVLGAEAQGIDLSGQPLPELGYGKGIPLPDPAKQKYLDGEVLKIQKFLEGNNPGAAFSQLRQLKQQNPELKLTPEQNATLAAPLNKYLESRKAQPGSANLIKTITKDASDLGLTLETVKPELTPQQKAVSTAVKQIPAEKLKTDNQPVSGNIVGDMKGITDEVNLDMANNFAAEGASWLASTFRIPEFAYGLTKNVMNPEQAATIMLTLEPLMNSIKENNIPAEFLEKQSEEIKSKMQVVEGTISERFAAGDYANGFKMIGNSVAGSAPATLGVILTGGGKTGLTLMGLSSAVAKKEQLDKQAKEGNLDITETQKYINSVATGTAEALFESIGVGSLARASKSIFAREGADAGKEILRKGILDNFDNLIKKYPVLLGPLAEGSSEWATAIAQNAADKYTGVDPERDLFEGATDALIVGTAMGGGFGAVLKGAQVVLPKLQRNKVTENQQNIQRASELIQDPNITPEKKEALDNLAAKSSAENTKLEKEGLDKLNSIPEDKRMEFSQLSEKASNIEDQIDTEQDPLIKTALESELTDTQTKIKEIENAVQKQSLQKPIESITFDNEKIKPDVISEGTQKEQGVNSETIRNFKEKDTIERNNSSIQNWLDSIGRNYKKEEGNKGEELFREPVFDKETQSGVLLDDIYRKWQSLRAQTLNEPKVGESVGTTRTRTPLEQQRTGQQNRELTIIDELRAQETSQQDSEQGNISENSRKKQIEAGRMVEEIFELSSLPNDPKKAPVARALRDLLSSATQEENQSIINEIKNKLYAISQSISSKIPVQPETSVGQEVQQGQPQAEPQVAAQEGQKEEVVDVSNKEQVTKLKERVSDAVKTKIVEQAEKGINTLKSVLPNFNIEVYENTAAYNTAINEIGGEVNSAGTFSYQQNEDGTFSGKILVNLDTANERTISHEITHGVLLGKFGDTPEVFSNFHNQIKGVVSESDNARLNEFVNQYDESSKPEEYLAELSSIMSTEGKTLSPDIITKIAKIVNQIVSTLTGGTFTPFAETANKSDVINFFNQISQATQKGEAIGETALDGVTEQINPTAPPSEKEVDTSSLNQKYTLIQDLGLERFPEMKGRIETGKTLADLGPVTAHLTFSDRLATGKVGDRTYLGGILFGAATNNLWASFSKGRVNGIINGAPKNEDGYRYIMPAILTEEAHMSNKDMLNTSLELVEKNIADGTISPQEANDRITKALNKTDLKKFAEIYNTFVGTNVTAETVKKGIDEAIVKSKSTFQERRSFLESILGKANIDLTKRFGNLPSFNELANGLAEPITQGFEYGDILLTIRTKGDLTAVQPQPGDPDYHPSYPWVIRSSAPVETLVFKNAYNAVDVFPKVTNKQGQTLTYEDYKAKYGEGAKSRYLGYMGGSKLSTNVTEPIVSEAKVASKEIKTEEDFQKANEEFGIEDGQTNFKTKSQLSPREVSTVSQQISNSVSEQQLDELKKLINNDVTVPTKTKTVYKLFKVKKGFPGELFPLFVGANQSVTTGEWIQAKAGELTKTKEGKTMVKSTLGPLAYRPGWHSGDIPLATHIGSKVNKNDKAPSFRSDNQVWAEVEVGDDVDWQTVANERAEIAKNGKPIAKTAHITDQVPLGGSYKYKTNSNMTGSWVISGEMKVNKVLTQAEVDQLNKAEKAKDLPRREPFDYQAYGFDNDGSVQNPKQVVSNQVARAYLDAKETGNNPELVSAVDSALGAPIQTKAQKTDNFKETIDERFDKLNRRIENRENPNALEAAEELLPEDIFNKYVNLYEMAARNNLTVSNQAPPDGAVAAWAYNNIQLNKSTIKYYVEDYNELAETLNHEIIHGLLSRGIRNNYTLYKDLQGVMKKIEQNFDSASEDVKGIIGYIQDTRNEYSEKDIWGATDEELRTDKYRKIGDLQELITYAFTDKRFAEFLDSIPAAKNIKVKGESIFQQLKNIIREFVTKKVKGPTALDEINSVLDKYFDTTWSEQNIAKRNQEYNWGLRFEAKNKSQKYTLEKGPLRPSYGAPAPNVKVYEGGNIVPNPRTGEIYWYYGEANKFVNEKNGQVRTKSQLVPNNIKTEYDADIAAGKTATEAMKNLLAQGYSYNQIGNEIGRGNIQEAYNTAIAEMGKEVADRYSDAQEVRLKEIEDYLGSNPVSVEQLRADLIALGYADLEIFTAMNRNLFSQAELFEAFGKNYRQTVQNAILESRYPAQDLNEVAEDTRSIKVTQSVSDLTDNFADFTFVDANILIEHMVKTVKESGLVEAANALAEHLKGKNVDQIPQALTNFSQLTSIAGRILVMARMAKKDMSDLVIGSIERGPIRISAESKAKIKKLVQEYNLKKDVYDEAKQTFGTEKDDASFTQMLNAEAEFYQAGDALMDVLEKFKLRYWNDVLTSFSTRALLSIATTPLSLWGNIEQGIFGQVSTPVRAAISKVKKASKKTNKLSFADYYLNQSLSIQKGLSETWDIISQGKYRTPDMAENYMDGIADVNAQTDIKDSMKFIGDMIGSQMTKMTDEEFAAAYDKLLYQTQNGDIKLANGKTYTVSSAIFRSVIGTIPEITGRMLAISGDRIAFHAYKTRTLVDYVRMVEAEVKAGKRDTELQRYIAKELKGKVKNSDMDLLINLTTVLSDNSDFGREEALKRVFMSDNFATKIMGSARSGLKNKITEKYLAYLSAKTLPSKLSNVLAKNAYQGLDIITWTVSPFTRVPVNVLAAGMQNTIAPVSALMSLASYMKFKGLEADFNKKYGANKIAELKSESAQREYEKQRQELFEKRRQMTYDQSAVVTSAVVGGIILQMAISGALTPPAGADDEDRRKALNAIGVRPSEINITYYGEWLSSSPAEREKLMVTRGWKKDDLVIGYQNFGLAGQAMGYYSSNAYQFGKEKVKKSSYIQNQQPTINGVSAFFSLGESSIQNISALQTIGLALDISKAPDKQKAFEKLLGNMLAATGAVAAPNALSFFAKGKAQTQMSLGQVIPSEEVGGVASLGRVGIQAATKLSRNSQVYGRKTDYFGSGVGVFGEELKLNLTGEEPGTGAAYFSAMINPFGLRSFAQVKGGDAKAEFANNLYNTVAGMSMVSDELGLVDDKGKPLNMWSALSVNKNNTYEIGSGVSKVTLSLPFDLYKKELQILGDMRYNGLKVHINNFKNNLEQVRTSADNLPNIEEKTRSTFTTITETMKNTLDTYESEFTSLRLRGILTEMDRRGLISKEDKNKIELALPGQFVK